VVFKSPWLCDSLRRRGGAFGNTVGELGDLSLALSFVVWRLWGRHGVFRHNLRASLRCPVCQLGTDVRCCATRFLYALDMLLCATDVLSERVRKSSENRIPPGDRLRSLDGLRGDVLSTDNDLGLSVPSCALHDLPDGLVELLRHLWGKLLRGVTGHFGVFHVWIVFDRDKRAQLSASIGIQFPGRHRAESVDAHPVDRFYSRCTAQDVPGGRLQACSRVAVEADSGFRLLERSGQYVGAEAGQSERPDHQPTGTLRFGFPAHLVHGPFRPAALGRRRLAGLAAVRIGRKTTSRNRVLEACRAKLRFAARRPLPPPSVQLVLLGQIPSGCAGVCRRGVPLPFWPVGCELSAAPAGCRSRPPVPDFAAKAQPHKGGPKIAVPGRFRSSSLDLRGGRSVAFRFRSCRQQTVLRVRGAGAKLCPNRPTFAWLPNANLDNLQVFQTSQ